MCVVSNVSNWQLNQPTVQPYVQQGQNWFNGVSREEFEALKKEIESFKLLLIAAKEHDVKTKQPDCEDKEKVEILVKLGKALGVNLEEVFSKK